MYILKKIIYLNINKAGARENVNRPSRPHLLRREGKTHSLRANEASTCGEGKTHFIFFYFFLIKLKKIKYTFP